MEPIVLYTTYILRFCLPKRIVNKRQKKSQRWRVGILNYSTIQITMSYFGECYEDDVKVAYRMVSINQIPVK